MPLKIDIVCTLEGSAAKVTPAKIETGVGGAELSMMSWAEVMMCRGHQVRVYNDPQPEGVWSGVDYLNVSKFDPLDKTRDVMIVWRSPSPNGWHKTAKAGLKIHWSCDQWTTGNYQKDIVPFVDKIVCISPEHEAFYTEHYKPEKDKIGHFDLGVRVWEYDKALNGGEIKKKAQ